MQSFNLGDAKSHSTHDSLVRAQSVRLKEVISLSSAISLPERFLLTLFDLEGISYEKEKRFDWSDLRRYDFFIKKFNLIIEVHGLQHFEDNPRWRGLEWQRQNDELKRTQAISNGITHYVEIDCRYSSYSFMKKNIVESLADFMDFSEEILRESYTKSQLMSNKEVIQDYGNGMMIKDIAEKYKISTRTVYRKLKELEGTEYTDYNSTLNRTKSILEHNTKISKPVAKMDGNGKVIEIFKSISEAERSLNISVSRVINGRRNTAGGFYWKLV